MAVAADIASEVEADPDPYPLALRRDVPFGTCIGVRLLPARSVDADVLRRCLHPDERPLASAMKGARLVEWIGGRVASRLARTAILGTAGPTLVGAGGVPTAEAGVSVSISHMRKLAVALASAEPGASVGVDIEPVDIEDANERLLAERILSVREREAASRDAIGTVQRLSIKEAAYKAIFSLYETLERKAQPHPPLVPAQAGTQILKTASVTSWVPACAGTSGLGTAQRPRNGRRVSLREISVSRALPDSATFQVSVPIDGVRVEALSFRVEECFLSLVRARFVNVGP